MFSERDRIHHQLLVLRCRRGDAAAWRELIAAWEPRLFYYVRRLVPREADAWDVLQQTWLGAYRNLRTLGDPKLLPAWLYRIARNQAISSRRARVPEATDVTDEQVVDDATLSPKWKPSLVGSAVLSSAMAALLTIAALSSTRAPLGVRIGVGLGAVYAAGWVVLTVRVVRRGTYHRRNDWKLMSAWPWVFMVLLVTVMLIMTGSRADSVKSIWILLYGLTFLLVSSLFLIQYWIGDARMRVEERLLETQLRIAELAEQLQKRG